MGSFRFGACTRPRDCSLDGAPALRAFVQGTEVFLALNCSRHCCPQLGRCVAQGSHHRESWVSRWRWWCIKECLTATEVVLSELSNAMFSDIACSIDGLCILP